MSLRSPLGRALGAGSAKSGVGHWWTQRLTAVALVLLGLWFVISLLSLDSLDYATVRGWLGQPATTIGALLLVLTLFWHSSLGVQVVIEDYVHHEALKVVSLLVLKFAHVALAVTAVYALLIIAFAAGVPA
jgi:succinate dehydrogenase / fumarate reductase, membrane anchor subunit